MYMLHTVTLWVKRKSFWQAQTWGHFALPESISEKRCGGDPRSAPEEQETPVYTRGWGGHYLTDTVHVDMSADWCVKQLYAWTPGAWRIDFARAVSGSNGNSGKQQRVWVLQVLLSVSAQFHRLHDSNNRTTQLEAESDLSYKLSGPDAGSTPLCCWILCCLILI